LVSIVTHSTALTLYLLTCRIWSAPNNASKRQLGFNLMFKGLNIHLNYNRNRKSNLVNKANLVHNFSY
jgi:outer membrane usher protein FimD/PapC